MAHCPPRRIAVAVDFGTASARAVALAGRIAGVFESALVAVHVETLEVPPYFTRDQLETIKNELRTARLRAETELREFVARQTRVRPEVRIVEPPAAEAILRAASDVDLIVMGTHGRRGPNRWWLGSVAERVVRDAPVPVLVEHAGGPSLAGMPERHPVVMSAERDGMDAARRWAEALATVFGGTVAVAPPADRCEVADLKDTSIAVVPVSATVGSGRISEATTGLARTCKLPFLFVPAEGNSASGHRPLGEGTRRRLGS